MIHILCNLFIVLVWPSKEPWLIQVSVINYTNILIKCEFTADIFSYNATEWKTNGVQENLKLRKKIGKFFILINIWRFQQTFHMWKYHTFHMKICGMPTGILYILYMIILYIICDLYIYYIYKLNDSSS